MISKAELYLDNEWQDVTAYLQSNNVVRQSRCDDAFATGTLQLRYDRSTNIPPYTLLRVNRDEQWFAKSTCRRYLTKPNYFVHNVELLELTSILSCYILGSKNFSVTGTNRKDYEKLKVISELMKQKYGVNFILEDSLFLDKEQEFTFGPGTTVYDAFLEIVKSYDGVKVKVTSCDPETNTYQISFKLNDTEYHLNEQNILDEYYYQDSESYGAILESEMTNVIDRTNTIKISDITLRSDVFHMTADNCCLMLPTRCEKVVDFGLNSHIAELTCSITLSTAYTTILEEQGMPHSEASEVIEITKTFKEWTSIILIDKTENINGVEVTHKYCPLDDVLKLIVENCDVKEELIKEGLWSLRYFGPVVGHGAYYVLYPYEENPASGTSVDQRAFRNLPVSWSLIDKILPKEKWDLLEDREKPKYIFYESGSNRIEGMNNYYKNDIWNKSFGNSLGPFLSYKNVKSEIDVVLDDAFGSRTGGTVVKASHFFYTGNVNNKYASVNYAYWIEYYPIIDPMVSDVKTINPINEVSQKNFARSYEKNSNFVEFDRMIDSLKMTNNMMGLPEKTIEYKLTSDEPAPKAFQHIIRDGKELVISSVVLTSSLSKEMATINLVTNYNKVADAIGVKTQYNETKNPLNNIVDRAVLYEIEVQDTLKLCNECWAKVKISDKELYKRVALMERAGVVYAYIEAIDQYCFDRQAVPVDPSNLTDNYYCNAISYCDSFNEAKEVEIELGVIPKLTYEESLNMPIYTGSMFRELATSGCKILYKDARERLIFTLKLSNCEIVPKSVFYNEE